MKRRNIILAAALVALLVLSVFIAIGTFLMPSPQAEQPEFYVGVQCGYNNVSLCKALIDKTKNYTNLFVIGATGIVTNASLLNEVCDYAYAAGMYFSVYFSITQQYTDLGENLSSLTYPNGTVIPTLSYRSPLPIAWINSSLAKYGDRFLGAYVFDEPGGNQLDGGVQRMVNDEQDYVSTANAYVRNVTAKLQPYLNATTMVYTADYGLYWFDFKAGYDAVLADFGFGNNRQLQVALCRGAADVQGKDWGVMVTHKFSNQQVLGSGPELYDELVLGYESGAKYAVVFNYAETEFFPKEGYLPFEYGILEEEHFNAMKDFWSFVQNNPEKHGSLKADVVLVLPEAYGFGFRSAEDKIWGIFSGDTYSQAMWLDVNSYLGEYGSRLDVVYDDAAFRDKVIDSYGQVFRWSSGNASETFPVRNLNSTFGYSTIQSAIDSGATTSGHVLSVKAGTYRENLVVNKPLSILGEDAATTIIDGGSEGTVVAIMQNNVNFTGFTVKNSGARPNAGIHLRNVTACTVADNVVEAGYYGIYLNSSGGNTLRNNALNSNVYGLGVDGNESSCFFNDIDDSNTVNGEKVYYLVNVEATVLDQSTLPNAGYLGLVNCSGITVQGLSLSGNHNGLLLVDTRNSIIAENTVENSIEGIRLLNSEANQLRGNSMSGNAFNLWMQNSWANDVDSSNTVNGKPVYFWIDQHDKAVPSDAGFVGLVNCSGITVQGLSLSDNWQGIVLSSTEESVVTRNSISDCYYGIMLQSESDGNTVSANNVTGTTQALALSECRENSVVGNAFSDNEYGVYALASSDSTFSENAVAANSNHGMRFALNCDGNTLTGNHISSSHIGVEFIDSSDSSIVRNSLAGNNYSIQVHGSSRRMHIAENEVEGSVCAVEIASNRNFYETHIASSSHSVIRNTLTSNTRGIVVNSANDSTIADNAVTGGEYGIALSEIFTEMRGGLAPAESVTVKGNTITDCGNAIYLSNSQNCSVIENDITEAMHGMVLAWSCRYNSLIDNSVKIAEGNFPEKGGIQLAGASDNILRRNVIVADFRGFAEDGISSFFGVSIHYDPDTGEILSSFEYMVNDVDSSNTVNGKPIYYWFGVSDKTVPDDASCVILVNCTNITVRNLNLTGNLDGVQLAYTHNSTVTGNNIQNNTRGIMLFCSSYNLIEGNNIANNSNGIRLDQRSATTGRPGAEEDTTVYPSTGNTIADNNITSNENGVSMSSDGGGSRSTPPVSGNTFYHDNFDNAMQINIPTLFEDHNPGENAWDNGAEGNHWSDYNGTDADHDGIGETTYTITASKYTGAGETETIAVGEDRFPLMHPFTR